MLRAVVLSTYSKNAPYIPYCIDAFNMMWPEHPELYVITDGDHIDFERVLLAPYTTWVETTKAGLSQLIEQGLKPSDYILFVIEDHCPLAPVHHEDLLAIMQWVVEHDIHFLSFHHHITN